MHPDHVNFRVKNRKPLMNFRILTLQSASPLRLFMNVSMEGLNPKNASSLFCVRRLNRYTSSVIHTLGRVVLTKLIPNCSNFDCESEGDRSSPRVGGESLTVFFRAAVWHRTWGYGAEKPLHKVSGSSILPTPGSEEPQKSFRICPILFNTPEFKIKPF